MHRVARHWARVRRQAGAVGRRRRKRQWCTIGPYAAGPRRSWPGLVNRHLRRSRSRIGRWACPARLCSPWWRRGSMRGSNTSFAAPSLASVSASGARGTARRPLGGRRDVTAARPSMPLETGSRCLRLVRWHGHSTARWRDPATTNAAPRSRPDRQPREERQAGGGARRPGPGRDASRLQGGDAASRHGVIQVCPGAAQRADAAMRGARRLVGHGGVPATPVGVADAPRAGAARAARLQGHFRARVVGQRPAVHAARVDGQGAPALRRGDICAIADPQAIPSRRPGAARDRVRLGRARRLGDRRAHPPAAAADHARRAQQPRHPLMRAAHPGRAARGVDPWGTSGPATPRVGGEHGERLARSPARGAPPRTGTPAGTAGRYASSDTSSSRTISPGIRITQAIPDAMNAESSAR